MRQNSCKPDRGLGFFSNEPGFEVPADSGHGGASHECHWNRLVTRSAIHLLSAARGHRRWRPELENAGTGTDEGLLRFPLI